MGVLFLGQHQFCTVVRGYEPQLFVLCLGPPQGHLLSHDDAPLFNQAAPGAVAVRVLAPPLVPLFLHWNTVVPTFSTFRTARLRGAGEGRGAPAIRLTAGGRGLGGGDHVDLQVLALRPLPGRLRFPFADRCRFHSDVGPFGMTPRVESILHNDRPVPSWDRSGRCSFLLFLKKVGTVEVRSIFNDQTKFLVTLFVATAVERRLYFSVILFYRKYPGWYQIIIKRISFIKV